MGEMRKQARVVLGMLTCGVALWGARGGQAPGTQALVAQGQKALAEKEYALAEQDFTALLNRGVRSAPVYSNLGVAYLHLGKIDKAIHALEKAKSLAPDVAGIRLNLGLAYIRENEFKMASRAFGEVIAMEPGHVQAHYLKGICDFMTDDFQGTVDALRPILEQEKNDLEYLFMLGISYGMLKKDAESQKTFAGLVEAGGNTPHMHLILGKAYLALGQLEEAEKELKQATQGQALPYAHYYRGMLAKKQGEVGEAAEEFSKEVALVPKNPWAYKELATIRTDQNDNARALEVLETGVVYNSDSAELHAALGRAYLKVPDAKRAIPTLKKAIALDPKNGMYHYQLGRAYLAEGRKQEAEAEMAQSRALTSGEPQGQMEEYSRDRSPRATMN